MKMLLGAAVAALVFAVGTAGAQSEPPTGTEIAEEALKESPEQAFVSSLHFEEGPIALPAAHATLQLTDDFRFLGKADARRVLEEYWGNPPDDSVLGLLVPTQDGLVGEHSWAVVLTWVDEGYVADEDAAEIDYDELLEQMQAQQEEINPELEKAGYSTVQLVGWAQAPRYDAGNKRLYWAKELMFSGVDHPQLNYDIRVLGREGHLSMNAVASMADLDRVDAGMRDVLAMAQFDEGHRYADFDSSTDRTAAYGLAALVGGGLAAKTGLLAKLGLLLAKGWKLIAILVVAFGAGIKKLFTKKDGTVT